MTFTTTGAGARSGQLTVVDTAGTQTATLGGTGTIVGLTPASIDYGNQTVGTSRASRTVTLRNASSSAILAVSSIAIAGSAANDFVIGTNTINPCGASLAPGASCGIIIRFQPTKKGNRTASLNVTDNADGSPETMILSGSGK